MDYRYLKAFTASATHQSFKKAALELRISPSAVTRQIALFEESVGGELFIRANKKVSLTKLGGQLAQSVARFEENLKSLQSEPPIRIGCLQSVFEFYLLEVIRKHPKAFNIALDIEIGSPEELQSQLEQGLLDLIITNHLPTEIATLTGFKLFQENLKWVGFGPRIILFTAFENRYNEKDRNSKNRIRINSFNSALALTQNGQGKALFAYPSPSHAKIQKNFKQWIYAVTPKYKNLPTPVRSILNTLKR